jgi:hypothetical protein
VILEFLGSVNSAMSAFFLNQYTRAFGSM